MLGDLLGHKRLDKTLDRIDDVVDKLPKSNQVLQTPDELISATLNDVIKLNAGGSSGSSDIKLGTFDQIFGEINIPKQRLDKYDIFDEIYNAVQIVKRIIAVYINNIFQKDSITNKVLFIKETEQAKNSNDAIEYKKTAQKVIDYFKLESKIKEFVAFYTLKYGDAFVEIINLRETAIEFPQVSKSDYVVKKQDYAADFISEYLSESESEKPPNLKLVEEAINLIGESKKNKKGIKYSETSIYQNIDTVVNYFVEFSETENMDKDFLIRENEILFRDFRKEHPEYIDEISKEDSVGKKDSFFRGADDSSDPTPRSSPSSETVASDKPKFAADTDNDLAHILLKYHKPHKFCAFIQ